MESFTNCAKREIAEESGIEIKNIRFHFVSNTNNYKPAHFVHIGMIAEWKSGKPKVLEPGGIEVWEWIDRRDTPKDLSIGALLTLQALEEECTMYDMAD
jgi:NADH pyrophosphatase NudC (nudix superfamily)